MNPGLLRERITLRAQVTTQDELGQPTIDWIGAGSVWARMLRTSGADEGESADRVREKEIIAWRVRAAAVAGVLDTVAAIVWKTLVFRKVGILRNPDGRGEYLDLLTERIEGGGTGLGVFSAVMGQDGAATFTEGQDSQAIVFASAFASAPAVDVQVLAPAGQPLISGFAMSITTTGFTLQLDAPIPAGQTYVANWQAMP